MVVESDGLCHIDAVVVNVNVGGLTESTQNVNATTFQRIWLPGFLFQSVIIGGGYATGRELLEFFLSSGPVGGLLGMLVATVAFSVIAVLFFELARLTSSYNYRHFFSATVGPLLVFIRTRLCLPGFIGIGGDRCCRG